MKRILVLSVLASVAAVPLVTVRAQSDRAKSVGMKLKCLCKGCDMSAGGCSHPGGAFSGPCSTAKGMMKEVDDHIAKGESDEQIMQAFVAEYGTIVYVEPPKTGFGLVAWLMPIFYAIVGLGLVVLVIRKWTHPARTVAVAGPKVSTEALQRARDLANRETED